LEAGDLGSLHVGPYVILVLSEYPKEMERADIEQKPGTTIHIMMEEHHFLNEFMEMMKRK
jgi:hypothetical protein